MSEKSGSGIAGIGREKEGGDREVRRKRSKQREQRDITKFVVAPTDAAALERTQISKYHTKGGHGFVAEDANTFDDLMSGKNAE